MFGSFWGGFGDVFGRFGEMFRGYVFDIVKGIWGSFGEVFRGKQLTTNLYKPIKRQPIETYENQ